jgi:hypothetical protein
MVCSSIQIEHLLEGIAGMLRGESTKCEITVQQCSKCKGDTWLITWSDEADNIRMSAGGMPFNEGFKCDGCIGEPFGMAPGGGR